MSGPVDIDDEDDGIEEDDVDDEVEDREAKLEAYDQLVTRCKEADIDVKFDSWEGEEPYPVIGIPTGRETTRIGIYDAARAKSLLAIEFEKYRFLEPYDAIVRYDASEVEAAIRAAIPIPFNRIMDRILGDGENERIELLPPDGDGPVITIGLTSEAFRALFARSSHFSIRIVSDKVKDHDSAVDTLETFSNSLFFQIDLEKGVPLGLGRRRRLRRRPVRRNNDDERSLEYPKFEYDSAPISLYWYARGATSTPLLRFLAYYQVVEYFFPLYSRAEAQRRIRSVLKDPTFRIDRQSDIGRIISCIQENSTGAHFDERTQLRATINEVIDADQVRSFVEDSNYLRYFYEKSYKKVFDHKIPINNKNADIRNDIADRLYGIRCKIVHTKHDGKSDNIELLLPYSKEEQNLESDILLMEFIAKSCLISSGSPIRL